MRTQHPRSRGLAGGEARALPRNHADARIESEPARPSFEQPDAGTAAFPQAPSDGDGQHEAIASSSCGDGKGRDPETARPLRLQCGDCEELLHELANVITGVLMQSQITAWKLPPYSHVKRSVREIERNAQRGSELMKRIMRRIGDAEGSPKGQKTPAQSGMREARGREGLRPHKIL